MQNFNFLKSYNIKKRKNEKKLGELIKYSISEKLTENLNFAKNNNIKFVILGVPEDIGPQANYGKEGAKNAWDAFLNQFLNTQANEFIPYSQLMLLGNIIFDDLYKKLHNNSTSSKYRKVEILRKLVEEIDIRVSNILTKIFSYHLIPIIIGGGHNNSFPILKSLYNAYKLPISCINIDTHTDFRPLEGRHSGNGFSYAMKNNYLNQYIVIDAQKQYNNQTILNRIKEAKNNGKDIHIFYFEDRIINKININDICINVKKKLSRVLGTKNILGLELDMDSIAYMPSSAFSPVGISINETIYYLNFFAGLKPAYLHIAEAAPRDEKENLITGKTISTFVFHFINGYKC